MTALALPAFLNGYLLNKVQADVWTCPSCGIYVSLGTGYGGDPESVCEPCRDMLIGANVLRWDRHLEILRKDLRIEWPEP